MLATLMFSQGTPMLLAGDEFGRTQGGNNNAYCQASDISWLSWKIEKKGQHLTEFTQQLTSLRRRYPLLRYNRFYIGEYNEELGIKDLTWINANGREMEDKHWGDSTMKCFGMLMDGRAQPSGIKKRGDDATLLLVFNGHDDLVDFIPPGTYGCDEWSLLIDTNREDNDAFGIFKTGDSFGVTGRSLLLFVLQTTQPSPTLSRN